MLGRVQAMCSDDMLNKVLEAKERFAIVFIPPVGATVPASNKEVLGRGRREGAEFREVLSYVRPEFVYFLFVAFWTVVLWAAAAGVGRGCCFDPLVPGGWCRV